MKTSCAGLYFVWMFVNKCCLSWYSKIHYQYWAKMICFLIPCPLRRVLETLGYCIFLSAELLLSALSSHFLLENHFSPLFSLVPKRVWSVVLRRKSLEKTRRKCTKKGAVAECLVQLSIQYGSWLSDAATLYIWTEVYRSWDCRGWEIWIRDSTKTMLRLMRLLRLMTLLRL